MVRTGDASQGTGNRLHVQLHRQDGAAKTLVANLRGTMDLAAALARAELFHALDDEAVAAVAKEARPVTLQRNQAVFSEGDAAEELYVVQSGRIAIAKRASDGRESVVALMEEDDLFGEM